MNGMPSSISTWRRWAGVLAVVVLAVGCEEPEVEVVETQPHSVTVESPFGYPVALWNTGVEGETVVMVHVTDDGAVDSVYVAERSGHAAFDSTAVAGAYELKFAPGRRGDRRVAMWVRVPVRFSMAEPGVGGTE